MNIDVREYLRINPISVHELSLSSNDNDCFLFFPMENEPRGYIAVTQWQMFNEFYKTIFGKLVKFDGQGHPYLDPAGVKLWELGDLFPKYAKRMEVEEFMRGFESELTNLEQELDNDILTLKSKGVLNYSGATEIQSIGENAIPSLVKYTNFTKAIGQIWCQTFGIQPPQQSEEQCEIGAMVRHSHALTKAETFTWPISRNKLGGEALGTFTTGNQQLVSQDKERGVSRGKVVYPISPTEAWSLTYPLYGQNMLDWRTPRRTHNNVPPCLNVYVKYMKMALNSRQATLPPMAYQMAMRSSPEPQVEISELSAKQNSHVEAQYKSYMVSELEEYLDESLSASDCLLRLQADAQDIEGIKMMRQGIQQLLDIFTFVAGKELSDGKKSISDILTPFLDRLLMTRNEFNVWFYHMVDALKVVQEKIQLVRQLMVSVKPLTYVGRVVVSTTDDIEQKVIAHYGGRRWRRIENFLRGVEDESELGRKLGEEYVCLRESNVPIHTHGEKLLWKFTTKDQDWLQKDIAAVETKLVNVQEPPIGPINEYAQSNTVENATSNYQMSPLEYHGQSGVTLPHDNMPPHIKVYIWECREITDEEQELLKAYPDPH